MRIIFSAILLFINPLSILFFIFYIFCGISDVLDGYIARSMGVTSRLGATLDSMADAIFYGVILSIFLPVLNIPFWIFTWITAIVFIRLISLGVGFYRYHAFVFLHTYANKVAGFILFCFPIMYKELGLIITACIICGFGSISAIEELIINLTSKYLNRDIKHIFDIK